jgi:hypothetical protein
MMKTEANPVTITLAGQSRRRTRAPNRRNARRRPHLRWNYLTHPDADHTGSLHALVEKFPRIRVVTTFVGMGILSLRDPLQPDRVYLLNPDERLDLGDRSLVCLRPPTFDNPATTAVYDTRSCALFSSDAFGAVVQSPTEEAFSIPREDLRAGQLLWSSVDAPWLHNVDRSKFAIALNRIQDLDQDLVLSAHLPPARAMLPQLLEPLSEAPDQPEFMGPNQAALSVMLRDDRLGTHRARTEAFQWWSSRMSVAEFGVGSKALVKRSTDTGAWRVEQSSTLPSASGPKSIASGVFYGLHPRSHAHRNPERDQGVLSGPSENVGSRG